MFGIKWGNGIPVGGTISAAPVGVPDAGRAIGQNLISPPWNWKNHLGEWHHFEVYWKLNDPGQMNGILHAWIDGVQVIRRTDVNFRGTLIFEPGNASSRR